MSGPMLGYWLCIECFSRHVETLNTRCFQCLIGYTKAIRKVNRKPDIAPDEKATT